MSLPIIFGTGTYTSATNTFSGVDLNDGAIYQLAGIDLGANAREEYWIEPTSSDIPIQVKVARRRCVCSFTLIVKGTSATNLQTRVQRVRNQFTGQANTLNYSIGGVMKIMNTYDSQIDPVDLMNASEPKLVIALGQFLIPSWTVHVTRDALFQGDTLPPVI